jgi:hypothetical protein
MSYATRGRSPQGARHMARSLLMLPFMIFFAVTVLAAGYVAYVLWPRWPGPPIAADAPSLPIVVGGTVFQVPPGAIRRAAQRRPGAQERIDLVLLWPSLTPPPAEAAPFGVGGDAPSPRERLFVTVAESEGATAVERMKTIYTRYLKQDPLPAPNGLIMLPFRHGTPYQGEDLLYPRESPERFLLRCTQTVGLTPGTCLHERRIGGADVTVRFPRAWLNDWRSVASGIDSLLSKLR